MITYFKTGDVIAMPVPSSYNDITQDKALRDFIGWVWYDREVYVPKAWNSEDVRVNLRFESAHYNTIVVSKTLSYFFTNAHVCYYGICLVYLWYQGLCSDGSLHHVSPFLLFYWLHRESIASDLFCFKDWV